MYLYMCFMILDSCKRLFPCPVAQLFTRADESRGSKPFSDVCLSVCVSIRTITQKQMNPKCS